MHTVTEQFITRFMQRRVIAIMGIKHAATYSPEFYIENILAGHAKAVQRGIASKPHYQETLKVVDDLNNNRQEVAKLIAGLLGMM